MSQQTLLTTTQLQEAEALQEALEAEEEEVEEPGDLPHVEGTWVMT